jgi:sugar phosphate isomerase/epimerase
MANNDIKLGATLYSFSSEFITDQMTLEDCLRKSSEMGYEGVEIVASQMVPGYPYPTDEWLAWFKDALAKYNLQPVCWSAYIDMGIRTDRDLTEDEIIQSTVNDLICAKKAGFPMVRSQHAISPKIFRKMIPFCKELGMLLTIEMHNPHHPEVPVWKEYFEIMKGEGKGVLGFVPDMSIFQTKPHKLWLDEALSLGCRPEKMQELIDKHNRHVSEEELVSGDYSPLELEYAADLASFNPPARIEQLKDLIDCAFYMHGKFYYIDEDLNEGSIPYEEILPKIRDYGYKGYIACEYEGHHFSLEESSTEQLRRYVAMTNKILG